MFRCKVGGEWKPLSAFSDTQQKLVQPRRPGAAVNAANSGMTCREHASTSRTEMRCEVCNLIKPLSCFSKSSRRNGDAICKRCGAWEEIQEPDVTPSHLETGHISIEEEANEVWQKNYVESTDFFGDATPQAPISGLSALGLEEKEISKATEAWALQTASTSIAASSTCGPTSTATSSAASVVSSTLSSLPPHLRMRANTPSPLVNLAPGGGGGSSSSISVENSDAATSSSAAASVSARTVRTAAVVEGSAAAWSFNAWDPTGNMHRATKAPTTTTSTSYASSASPSASVLDAQTSDLDDTTWEVVRKENHRKPKERKGGWAKPSRLKGSELRRVEPPAHITARHADPVVDAQVRMNYCQSEDSAF